MVRFRPIAMAVALAAAVLLPLTAAHPASARAARVDHVVDGDTIKLANGSYVRLIGFDTPEVGECGYRAAKRRLDRLVGARVGLRNPASVDDQDDYGRLLRYVRASGRDPGVVLIKAGLADARYDGRDGYQWHPRQARYRRLDAHHPDVSCTG